MISEREIEVLTHVAKGEQDKVIAYHLGISTTTVKVHLANIRRKLNARNRVTAIIKGRENGCIA
jgi:DNA-binding NarL/FixJ family response regulator